MIIKPLGADKVQYVPQSQFIPVEYDVNGRLIKVIFPEIKRMGDNDYRIRLEYHALDYEKGLTITNRAFRSNDGVSLGAEIPLTAVSEWAELIPQIAYPLCCDPLSAIMSTLSTIQLTVHIQAYQCSQGRKKS